MLHSCWMSNFCWILIFVEVCIFVEYWIFVDIEFLFEFSLNVLFLLNIEFLLNVKLLLNVEMKYYSKNFHWTLLFSLLNFATFGLPYSCQSFLQKLFFAPAVLHYEKGDTKIFLAFPILLIHFSKYNFLGIVAECKPNI